MEQDQLQKSFDIVSAQRDQLAVRLARAEVDIAYLQTILADTSAQLTEALSRLSPTPPE